jgi:hypothetical protein
MLRFDRVTNRLSRQVDPRFMMMRHLTQQA